MENTSLTSFLYELMRDHLPCGTIEVMVRHIEEEKPKYPIIFSNIDLANYAEKLAKRMLQ